MMKLKEICSFQSGGTPSKSNPAYFNGTIPWITTVALNGKTINETDAVEWITEQAVSESAAKIVPAYSIMVGTRVGVGKTAINTFPMSTSQDIISLIGIDESKWDKGFINKLIQSKSVYLNSQARGATIKGIKIDVLADLSIPDLPKDKQKEIVTILDNAQCVISKRQHELRSLDELIKARFVEMFGETSPSVKLGDICRMINGDRGKNYPSGNDFVAEGVPFVNAGHLQNRQVDFSGMNYITEEKFDLLSQGKMQEDDILYCLRGSLGKHGLVTFERGAVASSLVILRCDKSKVLPKYLLYAIETPDIERQLKAANNGSSQPNLSAASVRAYDIKLPSLDEQRKFVAFVAQVDKSKFIAYNTLSIQQKLVRGRLQYDQF